MTENYFTLIDFRDSIDQVPKSQTVEEKHHPHPEKI